MHGQILLEQHNPAEADAYFTLVGDSLAVEIAALQAKMNSAMAQAARGLVAARASGALFVREASTGKSLMLAPDAGAGGAVMVAIFGGQMAPAQADSIPPVPVTQEDLRARFAALDPPLPADVPTRPFYANASGPAVYGDYVTRDQNLLAADLSVASARYKLQVSDADYARRLAALKNFQMLILEGTANLGEQNKQIAMVRDSSAKMTAALAAAREKIRTALTVQGIATANAASKNMAQLDSVKASLGSNANAMDMDIMATEMQTAATYRRVADRVLKAADSAIRRHPAFATRDSIAAHLLRSQTLATEGQRLLLVNAALVQAELTRLGGAESDRSRAAKQTLASAEQRRTTAEQQMVSLLDGELRARATQNGGGAPPQPRGGRLRVGERGVLHGDRREGRRRDRGPRAGAGAVGHERPAPPDDRGDHRRVARHARGGAEHAAGARTGARAARELARRGGRAAGPGDREAADVRDALSPEPAPAGGALPAG